VLSRGCRDLDRGDRARLELAFRPDLTFSALPCNPENARRFIKN
jgi:hypothetical protein